MTKNFIPNLERKLNIGFKHSRAQDSIATDARKTLDNWLKKDELWYSLELVEKYAKILDGCGKLKII